MYRPEDIFVFSAIQMHLHTVFTNKYYSKVELQLTLMVQNYLLKNDFLQSSLKSPLCPLQVSGPSLKTWYLLILQHICIFILSYLVYLYGIIVNLFLKMYRMYYQ